MSEYIITSDVMAYLRNVVFFLVLIALSSALTVLCRKYVKLMDYPSSRSMHDGAVPRSGGIAIVATFCVGILVYCFVHENFFIKYTAFAGLFLSAIMIALVGLYDDLTDRGLSFKLISQVLSVAILVVFGMTINDWTLPIVGKVSMGPMRYVITVLWIVGMTNAYNFMDGINGLAAGVAIIASLALTAICFLHGGWFVFHVGYMLAACCIGFIVFNYPKASIFMGDMGSTFIGFMFGALAVLVSKYDVHVIPFTIIPLLLANIILETMFTFIWRLFRGESVHRAHKSHPYQLLCQMGVSPRTVAIMYYAQSVMLAIAAWIYMQSPMNVRVFIIASVCVIYLTYFIVVMKLAYTRKLLLSTI